MKCSPSCCRRGYYYVITEPDLPPRLVLPAAPAARSILSELRPARFVLLAAAVAVIGGSGGNSGVGGGPAIFWSGILGLEKHKAVVFLLFELNQQPFH